MYLRTLALLLILALPLTGCGDPSKENILGKAQGAKTKQELEKALGEPDDIEKLGPIAKWTYNASDGKVIYIITGDTVALARLPQLGA
ncbi:MAG: hypothetical protein GY788_01025 [bacterium]|nr:hypothetical protein [bacterium]